jgi:hypothetical protein
MSLIALSERSDSPAARRARSRTASSWSTTATSAEIAPRSVSDSSKKYMGETPKNREIAIRCLYVGLSRQPVRSSQMYCPEMTSSPASALIAAATSPGVYGPRLAGCTVRNRCSRRDAISPSGEAAGRPRGGNAAAKSPSASSGPSASRIRIASVPFGNAARTTRAVSSGAPPSGRGSSDIPPLPSRQQQSGRSGEYR